MESNNFIIINNMSNENNSNIIVNQTNKNNINSNKEFIVLINYDKIFTQIC